MRAWILSILFVFTVNSIFAQCPNDVCQTAIELELCKSTELSEGCSQDWNGGDINLYGTGDTGGCGYQDFQFDEDQWFIFTVDEVTQIVINIDTDYQAPEGSDPCPVDLNGTTQGISFILWTGDNCESMIPVINTWNPSYCNGSFVVPPCPWSNNICNNLGCPTPSNTNVPSWIDTESPAYLATAYWNYFCCVNWNSACENRYALYNLQYNLSFDSWFWEVGYPPETIEVDQSPQDYLVLLTLVPGTYWIQLDPISCNPNNGGYSSEGSGTINVCPLFFLDLEEELADDPSALESSSSPNTTRFKKIIHPRFGFLIYDTYRDRYYDTRMKLVPVLR